MWAGIRHGAAAEILNQIVQFGPGQGVVGLDGVAANGLGNNVFPEAQGVDILSGSLEFIDQFQHEFAGIRDFYEGWQGVQQEGALTEFRQAHAQPGEGGQLIAHEIGIASGQLHGFRQQELLGIRLLFLLQACEHLFEEDALVRGVLVQQHQSAVGLQHDVKLPDDADEAERDA